VFVAVHAAGVFPVSGVGEEPVDQYRSAAADQLLYGGHEREERVRDHLAQQVSATGCDGLGGGEDARGLVPGDIRVLEEHTRSTEPARRVRRGVRRAGSLRRCPSARRPDAAVRRVAGRTGL